MAKFKIIQIEQACSKCNENIIFNIDGNKIRKRKLCPNCETFNYIKMDTIYSSNLVPSGYKGDFMLVKQVD